jgi:hypothetical protein
VTDHKFAVGQTVYVSLGLGRAAKNRSSAFNVVRLLPAERNDHQYRIKSALDGHERVVKESQLS